MVSLPFLAVGVLPPLAAILRLKDNPDELNRILNAPAGRAAAVIAACVRSAATSKPVGPLPKRIQRWR